MNNSENIKDILDHLRQNEGPDFELDEKSILVGVEKDDSQKESLSTKILSLAGGFLAVITFTAFLYSVGLMNSQFTLLFLGFCFIGTALYMNLEYEKLIFDTASVSGFLTGFLMLDLGLGILKLDQHFIFLSFILLAGSSFFLAKNYILPFLSLQIVTGSVLALFMIDKNYLFLPIFIAVVTFLLIWMNMNEAKIIAMKGRIAVLFTPLRSSIIFTLLYGLFIIGKKGLINIAPEYYWLSSLVTIPVSMYLIYKILEVLKINRLKDQVVIYAISGLILIATVFAPAISGALIILLSSFYVNYKTGFVIGIISTIYFISQYYYDLNLTLLQKSEILFTTGILFFIFYLIINKSRYYEKI